jgi:hypothetical protein
VLFSPQILARTRVFNGGGGGGAGGFTPSSLTGLIGWWDANDTPTLSLSGADLVSIADKSGNSNTMSSGAARPTYSATSFNGRPGISFYAGSTLTKSTFGMGTGNTLTVGAVLSLTNNASSTTAYGRVLSYNAAGASHDFDNNGSWVIARDNLTSNLIFVRNNAGPASTAYGYATPKRVICTIKSDGTETIYINNVATSASASAANWVSAGDMDAGTSLHDSSGSGGLDGIMGEWIVATGYSDATTVASLDTYLKNKWGL